MIKFIKFICTAGTSLLLFSLVACASESKVDVSQSNQSTEATVIDLTQTGCQFLEVEAKNHQYQPKSADDCQKINSETLSARKSEFKPLELPPGKYVFRITNSNVPYELGFYLRGEGVKKLSLPKVSGGGLSLGKTEDYEITLITGKYVFSCPLNPTPDYPIIVN
jgi:hypothetical protein